MSTTKTKLRSVHVTVRLAGAGSSFEIAGDTSLTTPRPSAKYKATGLGSGDGELLRKILKQLIDAYGTSAAIEVSTQGHTIK